jgi:hypothetical protein
VNIYKRLQECRVALQNASLKKSGKNGHLGFNYFTLDDFMGVVNKLFLDHDLCSMFNIITTSEGVREAELIIFYQPEGKEVETLRFTSPIADAQLKGSTPIQTLGAIHTYMRRYLYVNALEIAEPEVLDYVCGSDEIITEPIVLDETLLKEAEELKLSLDKIAKYFKKSVNEITNEDLAKGIVLQKEAIAKALAKKNKE